MKAEITAAVKSAAKETLAAVMENFSQNLQMYHMLNMILHE
jgi:hypothetical protein